MALVSGGRSTLNPDAPMFIPAALRQVEDFSPEWWNLVTTSTWYNEYWQSQHQEQDFVAGNDEMDRHDLAGLLPDEFDFGVTDDFALMEAQYEEFLQYSEAEGDKDSLASKGKLESGLEKNSEKSLRLSVKENGFKNFGEPPAKYQEKPAKMMSPRSSHSRIQQPRRM